MADLDLVVVIGVSGEASLDLTAHPYDLHAESLTEVRTSFRRKEVTNPHVEGSYLLHAERENQRVPLVVWVQHDEGWAATKAAYKALESVLQQDDFKVAVIESGQFEEWDCMASDYTLSIEQAYRHTGLALIRAQVVRLPTVRSW